MIFFSSILWWVLLILELIAYFLMRLIQYGRGASKNLIEITTGWIQLLVVILAFIIVSWKGGLAIIVAVLLWSFPTEFIVYLIYKKMYPESEHMTFRQFRRNYDYRKKEHKLSKTLNQDISKLFTEEDNFEKDKEVVLLKASNNLNVLKVLEKYGKTVDDLDSIHALLSTGGMNLADTVFQSPKLLDNYFDMKTKGKPDIVINYKLAQLLGII